MQTESELIMSTRARLWRAVKDDITAISITITVIIFVTMIVAMTYIIATYNTNMLFLKSQIAEDKKRIVERMISIEDKQEVNRIYMTKLKYRNCEAKK